MKSTKSLKKNSKNKANGKKAKSPAKNTAKKAPENLHKKTKEAIRILSELGLPKQQVNERTALTILALFDLTKSKAWKKASRPLIGVYGILEHMDTKFEKQYAANSREGIRRQSLHQLIQAGLVNQNPDKLDRPINSKDNVYQATEAFAELVRVFGTKEWGTAVKNYLFDHGSLAEKIKEVRSVPRFEVKLTDGAMILLSQGGQNPLIKQVIEEFCSRYVKTPEILYIGDAHKKNAFADTKKLARLGITLDEHGKAPDVIVHDKKRKWLLLIEAVTSHGPMNAKRKEELREVFKDSKAPLVFVTAFEDTKTFIKHAQKIAWETEVWIASDPTHMIHYNGDKFLAHTNRKPQRNKPDKDFPNHARKTQTPCLQIQAWIHDFAHY